jgi:hypothetical protein
VAGISRWREDGREIFYVSLDRQLRAPEVTTKSGTLEVGAVRSMFALRRSMSRRTGSASCTSLSLTRSRLGRSR